MLWSPVGELAQLYFVPGGFKVVLQPHQDREPALRSHINCFIAELIALFGNELIRK